MAPLEIIKQFCCSNNFAGENFFNRLNCKPITKLVIPEIKNQKLANFNIP